MISRRSSIRLLLIADRRLGSKMKGIFTICMAIILSRFMRVRFSYIFSMMVRSKPL